MHVYCFGFWTDKATEPYSYAPYRASRAPCPALRATGFAMRISVTKSAPSSKGNHLSQSVAPVLIWHCCAQESEERAGQSRQPPAAAAQYRGVYYFYTLLTTIAILGGNVVPLRI